MKTASHVRDNRIHSPSWWFWLVLRQHICLFACLVRSSLFRSRHRWREKLANCLRFTYKQGQAVVHSVIRELVKSPPQSISSDFEQAFIQACRDIFPEATINRCYFHFRQSMWRNIQSSGLAAEYVKKDVRDLLKIPQVLAFVPEQDVKDKFIELKDRLHRNHSKLPFYAELTRWYENFVHRQGRENIIWPWGKRSEVH